MAPSSLDCLFQPLQTGSLRLKNRLIMAPMATGFDLPTLTEYFVARANGGVALITTGEASVHPSGRTGLPNELKLESAQDINALATLASRVRQADVAIVLQLNHAGRYSPGSKLGMQPVGPSSVMSGYTGETPRALSTNEVEELALAFVTAAVRAREAGFDGVEFLSSSGYLMSQFLSPLTNQRTDQYGGSLENRARFLLSIVREVRQRCGSEFNVCVKLDAEDGMEGGISLGDSKWLAKELVKAGADRLNVWAGWHESPRPMLPWFVAPASFAGLAAEIKKAARIPVSTVGRITSPALAAQIIREGLSDLVGIGRAMIADPNFAQMAQQGRANEIRPCIGCCHCFDQIVSAVRTSAALNLKCAVNPALGHEGKHVITKALSPKSVAVIGAGPAGLEAARVAALRGHDVTVYDKADCIGGLLNTAAIPPHKEGLSSLVAYYAQQLRLLGVRTALATTFNEETILSRRPQVAVLATGARPEESRIHYDVDAKTLTASEALQSGAAIGNRVVIVGGGMVGLETAEHLSQAGRQVTVVEMNHVALDMSLTARSAFVLRLRQRINIMASTRVQSIRRSSVIVRDSRGQEKEIPADTIVLATGWQAERDLCDSLTNHSIEFYFAGSCKVPGMIDEAIADGFRVGCVI